MIGSADRSVMAGIKIGRLAQQTGLSVRTLHYYDEIGLLSPSYHSDAGHRLYVAADIARLQQIKSLRQLGFSLTEIRDCLARPGYSPQRVIELHIARLKEQIAWQHDLCRRLEALADRLQRTEENSVEALVGAVETMSKIEQYYTPEQLQYLEQRRQVVGDDRIREVEQEWPALMAEVRAELDRGTDPADPRVRALAHRWMGLVEEFTGGDQGIAKSVETMWRQEESIHGMATAPMRELGDYIGKALAAEQEGQ